ncbi:MAG TPA: zinc transporter, partial [Gammaproteobacteria bacterium]|nr:zinc transporter [Gammaproteobacteria bacterium]
DHDDHEGHDDHAHHDHDGNDPHMWLDPANALVWLDAIASELGHIDPENAARYRANANTAKEEISHEIHHLEDHLKSVQGKGFLVFHDAYQYFENRFGISATGSISIGDASKPSPKRLQELKHHFEEEGIHCVLSEPQYSSKLIDSVFGGFKPHIGVADPIGVDLELGSGLYLELLENLASRIAECVNH